MKLSLKNRRPVARSLPAPNNPDIEILLEFMRLWLAEQKNLSPAMRDFMKRYAHVIGR